MDPLMQAATALADALEAENAALRVMDVPRAIAQFPHKAEWSRRLHVAVSERAAGASPAPPPERQAAALLIAKRLQALVEDNRRLLQRAMFVQGRVIATVARAIPPPRTSYGRSANWTAKVPPMTLSARA